VLVKHQRLGAQCYLAVAEGRRGKAVQAAAPEAAPAPAGRAEGRGGRQAENAPAFSGAPAPVLGGGRAPPVGGPKGRETPREVGGRSARVVRQHDQAEVRRCVGTEHQRCSRFAGSLAPQGAETGASRTVDAALAARGDEASASSAGAAFRPHRPGHRQAFSTATSETLLDDMLRQRGLTETCAEGCHRSRESCAGHDGAFRRSRVTRGAAHFGRRKADRAR